MGKGHKAQVGSAGAPVKGCEGGLPRARPSPRSLGPATCSDTLLSVRIGMIIWAGPNPEMRTLFGSGEASLI